MPKRVFTQGSQFSDETRGNLTRGRGRKYGLQPAEKLRLVSRQLYSAQGIRISIPRRHEEFVSGYRFNDTGLRFQQDASSGLRTRHPPLTKLQT